MEEKLYLLLLALASISFAALIRDWRDSLWWGTGLLTSFGILQWDIAAPPTQAMLILSLCCVLVLCNIVNRPVALLIAGAIAAVCHARLTEHLPLAMQGLALLLLPLLIVLILNYRAFRDDVMVDEALGLVLVGCLVAGFMPEIADGWASASSLQSLDEDITEGNTSSASIWLSGVCVLSGILYQRWKYR